MAESLDGKHAAGENYRKPVKDSRESKTLSVSCDFYYDPFCEVCCETKNRNIKHEGYCDDCVQFLCEDCLRVHTKLQAAQGHVIQTGDDMPKSMADKSPKFDYCDVHQRNRKDQFCGTHKVLICSQCVSVQHSDCPVKSVNDACKVVPTSEINVLYDKVSEFKTNLTSVVAQIDLNITELEKQKLGLMKEAQELKNKGIAKIEKLFLELTSETESTYKTSTADLGKSKNDIDDVIIKLECALENIDKMKGATVDTKTFLKIQDILKYVEHYKTEAKRITPLIMDVTMSLSPDNHITEILSRSFKMGSISLDKSRLLVALSIPEIIFPMFSPRSVPVRPTRGGRTSSAVSCQAAGLTVSPTTIKARESVSNSVQLHVNKRTSSAASRQAAGLTVSPTLIKARESVSNNVKIHDDKRTSSAASGKAVLLKLIQLRINAKKYSSNSVNLDEKLDDNKGTPPSASGQAVGLTAPLLKIKAKKYASYNVKLDDDDSDCLINGMVIINNGRRLLADHYNGKIKLFSRDMSNLCSLSVSTKPYGIAVTGAREAVVSCHEEKLLILRISDMKIHIKETVKLPFSIDGMALYKDRLLVSSLYTSPSSVKLIDKSGKVYWSTDYDQLGHELFYAPLYVACSNNGRSADAIVSDRGNDTLTVLNADTGDVVSKRQVQRSPRDVTTDNGGNIYVCYHNAGEVAVLSKDLSNEKVLLSAADGLGSLPRTIVYNAVDHQLLVSYDSDDAKNTADCFKLQ